VWLPGHVYASIVTHEHQAFQKITLLPNYLLSEHEVTSYRKMIQAARFTAKHSNTNTSNITGSDGNGEGMTREQEEYYSRYFPKTLLDELHYDDYENPNTLTPPSSSSTAVVDGNDNNNGNGNGNDNNAGDNTNNTTTAATNDTNSNTSTPSTPITPSSSSSSLLGHFKPIFSRKTSTTNANATSPSSVDTMLRRDNYVSTADSDVVRERSASVASEEEWMPCGICGLEVTWPYRMHSDAYRALVTHHCSNCGIVICTFCGPGGEKLPGDGISTTFHLPDFRISLPHRGLLGLQRVCVQCYFDSNYPGLE